ARRGVPDRRHRSRRRDGPGTHATGGRKPRGAGIQPGHPPCAWRRLPGRGRGRHPRPGDHVARAGCAPEAARGGWCARRVGTIRLLPLALAMAGGLEAGGHTGHLFALWAGAQGTKEMRDLLPRLLATEPGLRLVGAWIDGETRRVPDRLLVPMLQALARAIP